MSQKTETKNKLKAYSLSDKNLFVGNEREAFFWTAYWEDSDLSRFEEEIISVEGDSIWIKGENGNKHYVYSEDLEHGKCYILKQEI